MWLRLMITNNGDNILSGVRLSLNLVNQNNIAILSDLKLALTHVPRQI